MAHMSRGKDFVAYDNPYNAAMTGVIGEAAGHRSVLDYDVLLLGASCRRKPSSEWRSSAPEQCCRAKAVPPGKWSWKSLS
jgi:hypothetical protein